MIFIILGALLAHFLVGMLIVKRTLMRACRRIYAAELAHVTNYHHQDHVDRMHQGQIRRRTYGYVFAVLVFWEVVPFLWWTYLQLRASKAAIDQAIAHADPEYVHGLELSELGHQRIALSADNIVPRRYNDTDFHDDDWQYHR